MPVLGIIRGVIPIRFPHHLHHTDHRRRIGIAVIKEQVITTFMQADNYVLDNCARRPQHVVRPYECLKL